MPSWLFPFLGIFFGFVSTAVAVVYTARSTINKQTVAEQQDLITAQGLRLADQGVQIELLKKDNDLLAERVKALEETKDQLFEQLKSIPAFAAMTTEMVEMGRKMETMTEAVTRLVNRLDR